MKFPLAIALTISSSILASTAHIPAASAAFIGAYDPANWTVTNTNANGAVNLSAAPAAITVQGGDDDSFLTGTTDFSTIVASTGTLSFDWSYSTADTVSINDLAYYLLNGIPFQLSGTNVITESGVVSIPVQANDLFAFRVETVDNTGGRAALSITNFEAAEIPTPPLLGGLLMFGVSTLRRRSQQQ
jgi:hypothetical protein